MYVSNPLVSVIINCHNSEKYIRESINSALAQTYKNLEIIIWDNKSSDNTRKIIESFQDKRIKYFYSATFYPLGKARNKAITESSGNFLAFLDSDDIWLPEKLEAQIPLFEDSKVGIVISNTIFFSDTKEKNLFLDKNPPPQGYVFSELLRRYFVSMETLVLRKEALDFDNLFDERFSFIEEFDLVLRISLKWKLAYSNKVLSKWRIHSESLTWVRPLGFSEEREIFIEKMSNLINNFEKKYAIELEHLKRQSDFEWAVFFLESNQKKIARKYTKRNKFFNLKWFVFHMLTFFPFALFQKVESYRGYKNR